MTASYSSMLLSFLTLPSLEKVVENARDILELQKTIMIDPTDEGEWKVQKCIFHIFAQCFNEKGENGQVDK